MSQPPQRPQQHRRAQPSVIAGFIDRYGWRAYALPVLALLTVIGMFHAGGSHNRAEAVGTNTNTRAAARTSTPPAPVAKSATAAARTNTPPAPSSTSRSAAPSRVRNVSLAPDPSQPGTSASAPAHVAAAGTPCGANTSARKVVVSIASQHAWMCAGKSLAYSSAVTTGKSGGHATPTGTFTIQGNVTNTTLRGSDYAMHVAYWIQFNGDIGFHDASWQTMAFGSSGYTADGSRGCVHLPLTAVAWLHTWVQVGRTVVVVTKT